MRLDLPILLAARLGKVVRVVLDEDRTLWRPDGSRAPVMSA